ncbi:MAG: mechanosensitive ion channel protein MscS [Marinilabiliales bacterium]|nr:MAG: mechanosensitive ion channel protein MscS [Marinilabiliales bacterium]
MSEINEILNFELFKLGEYIFKVYTLGIFFLVFIIAHLILWVIKKLLFRKTTESSIDKGSLMAVYQIIKYVIWVIAIAYMLDVVGIKITVLVAGSAALLVGVGLGLQQTFNDVISGVILLSERSIKYGDVLEIDGEVVQIQQIGLRTSQGINRDSITMIIPNSLITTSKVINWSHQSLKTRFRIDVGVAYGSDVDLVLKVLTESAFEHKEVKDREQLEARFVNFGNSSLDFQLLFYSTNVFRIERIKSDIRKIIDRKFRENNITIPFPQMDLHLKTDLTKNK